MLKPMYEYWVSNRKTTNKEKRQSTREQRSTEQLQQQQDNFFSLHNKNNHSATENVIKNNNQNENNSENTKTTKSSVSTYENKHSNTPLHNTETLSTTKETTAQENIKIFTQDNQVFVPTSAEQSEILNLTTPADFDDNDDVFFHWVHNAVLGDPNFMRISIAILCGSNTNTPNGGIWEYFADNMNMVILNDGSPTLFNTRSTLTAVDVTMASGDIAPMLALAGR